MGDKENKIIWSYLYQEFMNPIGVAALMGNLFIESKLDPGYCETSKLKKLNMTKDEYISKVNDGIISCTDFSNDGVGFGLVQWTYKTRKAGLYSYAKTKGKDVSDLMTQLDYMLDEITVSYKTVANAIKTAKDIRKCSDIIAKKYEKPAAQDEAHLQNRANYSQGYYELYALGNPVVTATSNVNLREGNGLDYEKVGRLTKGYSLPYVATSQNGWYAVKSGKKVVWLSGQYAEIVGGNNG